ncbi:MAG: hypothetical protein RL701_1394 [Pseudomonadota bacterium]|jgi:hypothetical protein
MRFDTRIVSTATALALLSCPIANAQPAAEAEGHAAPADTPTTAPSEVSAAGPPAPAANEQPATPAPTAAATAEGAVSAETAPADSAAAAGDWGAFAAENAQADTPVFRTKLYGFIDTHLEKVANTPDSVDGSGRTVYASNPYELEIPNLNAMMQGSIYERYRFFLNLAGPNSGSNSDDEPLVVRNAWVEVGLFANYLNLRAGKTYRRFGLYNEILDAVPTFIGIEAPEVFDKDHLMLTRTTTLMLHGAADLGPAVLNYSVTSGNDERTKNSVPIGADVYLDFPVGLRVGSSFYSTGGDAVPSRGIGDGSPRGGVVNWMDRDQFYVVGGYAQLKYQGLILQTEYWRAEHRGRRNADALMQMAADANLNPKQLSRFFENGDPSGNPILRAKYAVDAFYVRAGYEISLGDLSTITPYLQLDIYSNPETINNKDFGGDNEAGLTDNGEFEKYTLGAVIRPVPQVAFKIDGSGHRQKFNGKSEFYPEIRLSLAYLWEFSP